MPTSLLPEVTEFVLLEEGYNAKLGGEVVAPELSTSSPAPATMCQVKQPRVPGI